MLTRQELFEVFMKHVTDRTGNWDANLFHVCFLCWVKNILRIQKVLIYGTWRDMD